MRQETVFQRLEVYAAAAAIAAHAHEAEGFRQRDVRFLVELCANWTENVLGAMRPTFSNTQVYRYLEELVRGGFARRRGKQPRYRLTRLGLIDLLSRMVNRSAALPPDQFLFVHYFLSSYRERLLELVQREGALFPPSLRIELEALLDTESLRRAELSRLERLLQHTESRLRDGVDAARLTEKLLRCGTSMNAVGKEIEKRYPYELNSQEPLGELLGSLPPDVARWELEVGSLRRVEQLWKPARELLRIYIRLLREL